MPTNQGDQTNALEERVSGLIHWWNARSAGVPALQLDRTWPSIGVLDRVTFALRNRSDITEDSRLLLSDVAAYFVLLARSAWKGTGAEIAIGEDARGVFISAKGGEFLGSGEVFVVPVEEALHAVLQYRSGAFPVMADYSRPISPDHNYLSLFGIGLMTGLSPYGEGRWKNETPKGYDEALGKIVKILGQGCVQWYERMFPDEMMGQVGDLYLRELIYPPTGASETYWGELGVKGILGFAEELKLDSRATLKLAVNLSQSPDELISSAGAVVGLAMTSGAEPEARLLASCLSKGLYLPMLRRALLVARQLFLKTTEPARDWLTAPDFQQGDIKLFHLERMSGMLPWMFGGESLVREKKEVPRLGELFEILSYFDFSGGRKLCEQLSEENPACIGLRLLRLYMRVVSDDFDSAERELRSLATEPGMEANSALYTLWGVSQLSQNRPAEAEKRFQQARRCVSTTDRNYGEVINDHGWSLLLSERTEEALAAFQEAVRYVPCPLAPLLNKAHALRILGREEELATTVQQCVQIAPLDRRCFANAFGFY